MPGEDTKLALAAMLREHTDTLAEMSAQIAKLCKRLDWEGHEQVPLVLNEQIAELNAEIRPLAAKMRNAFTEITGVGLPTSFR